ncbi:MAG: hypothetical protein AAGG51_22555 [Cyanobacteria bacterium P01_G01_bin.54]
MSIKSWLRGTAIATFCSANFLLMLTPVLAQDAPKDRSGPPRHPYDQAAVQRFLADCEAEAQTQSPPPGVDISVEQFRAFMVSLCPCLIWEIQDRFTPQEAVNLSDRLKQNDPQANAAMRQIVQSCIGIEE